MKRTDYISWDDYFLSIAILSSRRSKDPHTQTGATIVKDNKIISCGFNGMPRCEKNDDIFPWEGNEDPIKSKYSYVIHAEENAIYNSNIGSLEGASLYTTLFPCNECAKSIIQVGIKNVYYLEDGNPNYQKSFEASRIMFDAVGINYKKLNPAITITINKSTRIRDISKKAPIIRDIGKTAEKINPEEVAKALGAEIIEKPIGLPTLPFRKNE